MHVIIHYLNLILNTLYHIKFI
ncbi:hypothetical protein F383_18258 [Gossypium arboreum]|uniref:Uncharacterized protein n=1 Tax=Gossypium arboreum TaxID=29729 RepID=A0A0B0MWG0_GOSAR|nr:hypothetical protein F383_32484 [Gossypium arboreum]KHG11854.1 hypothetical protein F383_18258 [Gossypium arboreum]